MSGKRYLTLNEYDGALGGLQPNPAGLNDVSSPGGLSSIDHHWTHGLFGPPERVVDAYAGTGERYIYGPYGNLYTPGAHTNTYDDYRGPHSDRTEYETLHGDPYFWMQPQPRDVMSSPNSPMTDSMRGYAGPVPMNSGRELVHHRNAIERRVNTGAANIAGMNMSKGRPVVPRAGVDFVPSNIENFEKVESMIEFIDDPPTAAPKKSAEKSPTTCKNAPKPQAKSTPDPQKTTDVFPDAQKHHGNKNKTLIIVMLIAVLICIDLWGEFTHVFILQYLNKGKDASWMRYAIYALAATIAVIITVQYSGVKVPVCV